MKREMPSKKQISEYWHLELISLSKRTPDDFRINECFCCGRDGDVQRAHIKSRYKSGADTVENLHLLCAGCHQESEYIEGKVYWAWFNSKDIEQEHSRRTQRLHKMAEILIQTCTPEELKVIGQSAR